MDRSELERLDRDTLIARAEQSGVARARILTRPELVDELLSRAAGVVRPEEMARVRGLFGRARDLLTRVIERGLHLPDAAERIRERLTLPPLQHEPPLPTVTLAEIYAAQGHRDRAVHTLRDVLDREPDHAAARKLIERLQDGSYAGPASPALPAEDEIFGSRPASEHVEAANAVEMLEDEDVLDDEDEESDEPTEDEREPWGDEEADADDEADEDGEADEDEDGEADDDIDEDVPESRFELRRTDACVAIPVDRETLFVHWDVTEGTHRHLAQARPGGALVLRALVISPTWDGPASSLRDVEVGAATGDTMFYDLPVGAVVRAAIGWRVAEELTPIAHSPALEAIETDPAGAVTTVARWTTRGMVSVGPEDRDAAAIDRAFDAIRARAAAAVE